jgi:hypothetical protein
MDRRYDALIKALERGGPEAMERLLMDAQSLAYRFSVVVCGNVPDAEDAMQDALLQTYRSARRMRDPRAFRDRDSNVEAVRDVLGVNKRSVPSGHLLPAADEDAEPAKTWTLSLE